MKGSRSVQRAWKAYSLGDTAQAEIDFTQAINAAPDSAFAYTQRGLFFLRQDHPKEAASSFLEAADREHNNPAPLFFLAIAHELANDGDLADAALEKLRSKSPRHQGLVSLQLLREIRRGDPLPVLHQLGFGTRPSSKESWRSLVAGLGLGDPSWLPSELSSSPYLLGPLLLELEKRLLPRELPALETYSGDLLAELTELKPPKRSLTEELKGLPDSWRGGRKLRRGQRLLTKAWHLDTPEKLQLLLTEAIACLEEGQQLDPFAFRTNYYLGEAYLLNSRTAPGTPWRREPLLKAESHFKESIKLDGSNPYVLLYLAMVELGLGRPQAAIDCYLKSTEKFTKMPEAHYGLGQCYLLLGQPQAAREYLLKACSSDLLQARERLNLFAVLLGKEGLDAFQAPLPELFPPPKTDQEHDASHSPESDPKLTTPL